MPRGNDEPYRRVQVQISLNGSWRITAVRIFNRYLRFPFHEPAERIFRSFTILSGAFSAEGKTKPRNRLQTVPGPQHPSSQSVVAGAGMAAMAVVPAGMAVTSTGMAFLPMMMAAQGVGVKQESPLQQSLHLSVGVA